MLPLVALMFVSGVSHAAAIRADVGLTPNPSGRAPLTAVCEVRTDRPVSAALTFSNGYETTTLQSADALATVHRFLILGLRFGQTYVARVHLQDEVGVESECDPLEWTTPPLPRELQRLHEAGEVLRR